jgi:hypothetical protein
VNWLCAAVIPVKTIGTWLNLTFSLAWKGIFSRVQSLSPERRPFRVNSLRIPSLLAELAQEAPAAASADKLTQVARPGLCPCGEGESFLIKLTRFVRRLLRKSR